MEKRRLTGKDILRMDGLLPPTRRLPVCNAVITPEKRKEKKWSIGGLFKRISSIKDYESSSNEEEMVYCKTEPKKCANFVKRTGCRALRPARNDISQNRLIANADNLACHSKVTQGHTGIRKDSIQSRSSDGSPEGPGKKHRRSKIKARIEAKRDRLCGESSSDDDSHKSNNSLTKSQNQVGCQNVQKNGLCNRKTRAARTERYIKRLSRDEGHGSGDIINDTSVKQAVPDYADQKIHPTYSNESNRPPVHPQNVLRKNQVLPMWMSSTECVQDPEIGIPVPEHGKYSSRRYATDINQNDTCNEETYIEPNDSHFARVGKNYHSSDPSMTNVTYIEESMNDDAMSSTHLPRNCLENPSSSYSHCLGTVSIMDSDKFRLSTSRPQNYYTNSCPSDYRPVDYNDQLPECKAKYSETIYGTWSHGQQNIKPFVVNNEIIWCGTVIEQPRRAVSLYSGLRSSHCTEQEFDEPDYSNWQHYDVEETEQTARESENNHDEYVAHNDTENNLAMNRKSDACKSALSRNCGKTTLQKCSSDMPNEAQSNDDERNIKKDHATSKTTEEEVLERKRNSKNLEEALSELEAIYNSLRLGDEDLLDRAERRSMEEFSSRQCRKDEEWTLTDLDTLDRSTDDMAYRRMHPKERPASLSEIIEKSALADISYLIASPVLSCKDATEDHTGVPQRSNCRDEPDVICDDVVYRSINRANNTLKVLDPQPPFGIPLGPVTAATENDYLHTVPRKSEQQRSSYIPQSEPDVVTDDLAFRTLRKDAAQKCNSLKGNDISGKMFFPRSKRTFRSLSANSCRPSNSDSVDLRELSNIQMIKNDKATEFNNTATISRHRYFENMVSEGELSDQDFQWLGRKDDIDVNSNRQSSLPCQKKLRVFMSPITTMSGSEKYKKYAKSSWATVPTSTKPTQMDLDDEFCHSHTGYDGKHLSNDETAEDFVGYRNRGPINVSNANETRLTTPLHVLDNIIKTESLAMRNKSSDNQLANTKINKANTEFSEELDKAELNLAIESNLTETETNKLDYYLHLADENVKLIAEAFSSVADHIRDSGAVTRRGSTLDNISLDNGSVCSNINNSTIGNEIDSVSSKEDARNTLDKDESDLISIDHSATKMDRGTARSIEESTTDVDFDFSQAVHDLNVIAASLRENVKESTSDLNIPCKKHSDGVTTFNEFPAQHEEERLEEPKICFPHTVGTFVDEENTSDDLKRNKKQELLETHFGTHTDELVADNNTEIADTQDKINSQTHRADRTNKIDVVENTAVKRSDERTTESKTHLTKRAHDAAPRDVAANDIHGDSRNTRNDEGGSERRERDQTESEQSSERETREGTERQLDSELYNIGIVRSAEMRVPYVINLITVTITTYSLLLLAYFLTLLLAIVAAS